MDKLTHLNDAGEAHMVDVGGKEPTRRSAVAEGWISMSPACFASLRQGNAPKGDVLGAARIAGIMAAKRTWELIPLCHPLQLSSCEVEFVPEEERCRVVARCRVGTTGPTGVEMEALTGVSAALLTVYDMLKAADRSMELGGIRLLEKSGGKSGRFAREGETG